MSFFNEFNSFFIQMKISSGFFFRHYFSSLFIFIIELDKTRITEKNIIGRNIEEKVIRILKGYAHIYIMYFPEGTHQKQ